MGLLARGLKNRGVRTATGLSLNASAELPNSGFDFIDNAQGASAAVAELSDAVAFSLDQLETEGSLKTQREVQLQRLDDEAAKYANSRLEHAEPTELSFTPKSAELVTIAWKASDVVYQKDSSSDLTVADADLEQLQYIDRSVNGSTKSMALYKATLRNSSEPVLVVSIRGSKHSVDHMVNVNHAQKPLQSFINSDELGLQNPSTLNAHKGFLGVAAAMEEDVAELIQQQMLSHVVFTGHSAGGAVASLLYLRSFSWAQRQGTPFRYSLVTFGAPPVITRPLEVPQRAADTVVLNIINEYDIVPRADAPYFLSLVDLFRSIYSQAPESMSISSNCHPGSCWPLPEPDYYHIGERVVLQNKLNIDLCDDEEHDDDDYMFQLHVWCLSEKGFARLVFCNQEAHRRVTYGKRIQKLREMYHL